MFRRFLRHKVNRDKGLLLIFPKHPLFPRLLRGTFVGNVKYGLTIHPDKTRLVPFERPDHGPKQTDTNRREPPGTFDLLGFTHFWSRSLRGYWVVKRKTSESRFSRALKLLSQWCRSNRHHP